MGHGCVIVEQRVEKMETCQRNGCVFVSRTVIVVVGVIIDVVVGVVCGMVTIGNQVRKAKASIHIPHQMHGERTIDYNKKNANYYHF